MSSEVITHKHEWLRGLFSELDRIAKDAAMVADENQPLLGGEHYLTDREFIATLENQSSHFARLSQQRHFAVPANWVEKSFIGKAILNEYYKVAIEASCRLYPIRYNVG